MISDITYISELLICVVASGLTVSDVSALRAASPELKMHVDRFPSTIDVPHSIARDGPNKTVLSRFRNGVAEPMELIGAQRMGHYPVLYYTINKDGTGCIVAGTPRNVIAIPVIKGMCRYIASCGCRYANYQYALSAEPLPLWSFIENYGKWDRCEIPDSAFHAETYASRQVKSAFNKITSSTVVGCMSSEEFVTVLIAELGAALPF